MIKNIVITGAPGTGKTSIINELKKKKYNCYDEVSRKIISDQIDSNGDILPWKNLLKFSEKIFNVGFSKLSFTPFHNFWFMIKQIPELLKLKSYLSVYQLVGKFIKNNQLQQALSIQPLLLGGNPITTTSIYNLIHYLDVLESNSQVYDIKN